MKNAIILVLLAAVIFLGARLISIENQRYAATLGMCPHKLVPHMHDLTCLAKIETRTSWIWHLYHAVTG